MKNRLLYCISLAAALVFYVFYYAWPSQVVFFAVLFLPALSLLVSLPSMLTCHVKLTRCDFAQQESMAAISVVALPGRFFPSGQVRCRVQITNLTYGGKQSLHVRLCNRQKRTLTLSTQHCCCMETRVLRPRVYDYLGLFWLPLKKPAPVQTVIVPREKAMQPEPDLSQIYYKSYHPKNGGFAEVHEIRPFRDGDSLRDVHWKLSAKTDDLVLREAMEPDRNLILVALPITGNIHDNDSVLSQLMWLCRRLLDAEIAFSVRCFDLTAGSIATIAIDCADDLLAFLARVLQMSALTASGGTVPCHDADTVFYLRPQTEVEHEEA